MTSSPSAPPSRNKADRATAAQRLYDTSVFINCPFDEAYRPLFRAICFTVYDCGFEPRCALEVYDSGHVRIDKIMKLVEACRLGVHDISRTERHLRSDFDVRCYRRDGVQERSS